MLVCPVRDCRLPLARESRRMVCARGHSFDVARSGYVNLLQPQDRRSRSPGDSSGAVAARRKLHDTGLTVPLLRGISRMAAASADDTLLDAGCGEGFYAGNVASMAGCRACGADISIPAIDAAARRYPESEWIVANADRFIPCADNSFSLLLSITGRMNAPEFRRVLTAGGRLLVALAAPDDLIELRGAGRDRSERTIAEFEPLFRLERRDRITTHAQLTAAQVDDVLHSIYRPLRAQPAEAMRLTFSLDLLLFRR